MYAYAFNATPVKLCAPGAGCISVVKLNMSDVYGTVAGVAGVIGTYHSTIVHPYGVYVNASGKSINIYMPSGFYFSDWSFSIDGALPAKYTVCGMTLSAVYVSRAGMHNLTQSDNVYYIDPRSCYVYLFSIHYYNKLNITGSRAAVFWFQMPRAVGTWYIAPRFINALNATAHQYNLVFAGSYVGAGFYIANYTRVPTFASAPDYISFYQYGPIHYSALSNGTARGYGDPLVVWNIGPTPSDGVFVAKMPDRLYGAASIAFVANDTAGYIAIANNTRAVGRYLYIYGQRYAIGDITVADDMFTYTGRGIACPRYYNSRTAFNTLIMLTRLDRVREIEICSNRTDTLYVRVAAYAYTAFVDVLQPGQCRRLRWDAAWSLSNIDLYFYTSAANVCRDAYAFYIDAGTLTMGWRYNLLQNNTLKPVAPIDLDALYEAMWRQFIEELRRQNNATQQALQQWLRIQQNMSKSLADYMKSQPRYVGTIRVEAATSTWLKVVLSEMQKFAVSGASAAAGAAATALPGASSLSAAAAAAAVATAWAASRRALATAALLAGFAVLASALFVYYIYGTSVTAALVLAAVVLMSVGAAAAWFRRSED